MTCILKVVLLLGMLSIWDQYQVVKGDAELLVRFDVYQNPHGTGDNGHCCDGHWRFCQHGQFGGCDHKFTICLDTPESDNLVIGPVRCRYGKVWSKAVLDHDNITFGRYVADQPNPIKFNITGPMPTKFALKVDVWDDDSSIIGISGDDDHVDFLRRTIHILDQDIIHFHQRALALHNRTTLGVTVMARCAPDYYRTTCSKYCQPPRPDQHYRCDPNGIKVYHKG